MWLECLRLLGSCRNVSGRFGTAQVCKAFAVIVKVIGDIEDIKDHHALEKGLPCLLVFAAVAPWLKHAEARIQLARVCSDMC